MVGTATQLGGYVAYDAIIAGGGYLGAGGVWWSQTGEGPPAGSETETPPA